MEDYEYYYKHYRSKYYNACSEIQYCEQEIYALTQQKRPVTNRINALNAKIKSIESTLEALDKILGHEETIATKITKVNTNMEAAAINYSGMVNSEDVTNKNLTSTYQEEDSATSSAISSAFATVRSKKSTLATNLADFKKDLQSAQQELESLNSRIGTQQYNLSYWKGQKTNSFYNMEYYRLKMLAAY